MIAIFIIITGLFMLLVFCFLYPLLNAINEKIKQVSLNIENEVDSVEKDVVKLIKFIENGFKSSLDEIVNKYEEIDIVKDLNDEYQDAKDEINVIKTDFNRLETAIVNEKNKIENSLKNGISSAISDVVDLFHHMEDDFEQILELIKDIFSNKCPTPEDIRRVLDS